MTVGAIIAAASHRVARPIIKLGGITNIQRLTLTYHKAGVRNIVVITGFEDPEIKAELTGKGVIFLQLADYEDPELMESFRIGLNYLRGRCDRVFLTPVNAPLYKHSTLEAMMATAGDIVIPSFGGRSGHPILVSDALAPEVVAHQGPDGLAGFIRTTTADRRWIDVNDAGVRFTVHDMSDAQRLLPAADDSLIQASCSLSIRKARTVFDARTHLLLKLIDETHSVSGACRSMSLSLTRAWRMINDLEADLGFLVVNRSQGGHRGGKTHVSDEGRRLIAAFDAYNERVLGAVNAGFQEFWDSLSPMMVKPDAPRR
ncbi:LysR family transcriptional regulator [Propioniciclava tarda]|uniref:LysR family transcriptional regulator n=1 Tax=Propioniciclava tarda TaxID=433330 RepID=A0A4Q9KLM8_PROTD|nr:LysR family transcriptional regulator [Propioniciclava tarda]SMO78732.1 ModE molybdate transport repressor domain-containing protein [Propioniciclava tarda]